MYFQVTARVSNAVAGAHIFPAVAGNTLGGLLSGWLIRRQAFDCPRTLHDWLCHMILLTQNQDGPLQDCHACWPIDGSSMLSNPHIQVERKHWMVGVYVHNTRVLKAPWPSHSIELTAYSGFGAGLLNSAIFVCISAVIDPAHKAVAASGLFLAMPVGMVGGIAASSAAMLGKMRARLDWELIQLGFNATTRQKVLYSQRSNIRDRMG